MAAIVILGGGFGGLSAAHTLLPALLKGHTLTLIDRKDWFQMGLAKLWVLVGERRSDEGCLDLKRLRAKGVRFVNAEVTGLDVAAHRVRTTEGEHRYDHLILASGAEVAPDLVPGLPPEANLYDPSRVPALARRLEGLTSGTIAIVVCSAPYKCPPAPFEAAMLVDGALRARGARDAVRIDVAIPDENPMPVAGPVAGTKVRELLAEHGISLRASKKIASVEPSAGEIRFADGESLRYELLLAIPPHRAPGFVRDAGLTDASGFVPVDPKTLCTAHENVYAVGDVSAVKLPGPGMLPKAGIMAERQAEVVAANLLAALEGRSRDRAFDGVGHCFFEVGGKRAMLVEGEFFNEPGKRVRFSEPSAEGYASKQRFERERLARWLG